jgi:hypothetical protein
MPAAQILCEKLRSSYRAITTAHVENCAQAFQQRLWKKSDVKRDVKRQRETGA